MIETEKQQKFAFGKGPKPLDELLVGVRGGYQPETSDVGGAPSGGGGGKEPPKPDE